MKKYTFMTTAPALMFLLLGCGGGGTTNPDDALIKEETPQTKVEKKEPADEIYHDKEEIETTPTITTPKDDQEESTETIPTPHVNTAPTLTLLGDVNVTVTQHKNYSENGFIAEDKEDGNITKNVQVNSIDTSTLGEKRLNYSVKDSGGLQATASRTVYVVPSEAPLLKILGSSKDTYFLGQPYTEHGYSAWDKEDGDLKVTVDDSDLDMSQVGTYKISYSTIDSDSNAVVKYRTIVVSDSLNISDEDVRDLNADENGNFNTTLNLAEFFMPRESGEMVIKTYINGTLMKSLTQTTELRDENTSLLRFSHTNAKASYSVNANTVDIKIYHEDEVVSTYKLYAHTQNIRSVSQDNGDCFIKKYYNSININHTTYQDTIMISCGAPYPRFRDSYFVKGKGFLLSDENKTVY